eukprot:tig00020902_g14947.t1
MEHAEASVNTLRDVLLDSPSAGGRARLPPYRENGAADSPANKASARGGHVTKLHAQQAHAHAEEHEDDYVTIRDCLRSEGARYSSKKSGGNSPK